MWILHILHVSLYQFLLYAKEVIVGVITDYCKLLLVLVSWRRRGEERGSDWYVRGKLGLVEISA